MVMIMRNLKTILLIPLVLLTVFMGTVPSALATEGVVVQLTNLDPQVESALGNEEVLYVLVHYESDVPLRFQAIAVREGVPLEVGAIKNPAYLHAPGSGEALAWVGYTNPTHIDAVKVVVLDEQWQEIYQLAREAHITWKGVSVAEPRKPSAWVETLIKAERRKMDYVYDPAPQKYSTLYDLIFFLSIAAIPAYVLLQLHMLWRYRYRWRELAVIPIFPYLIVGFYYIAGLDIETSLQVTFLFRYTPLAFLYLAAVWVAKRFWQHKLPPPKLYKPPKAK